MVGVATQRLLSGRWGGIGSLIGRHYAALERKLLASSDHIVVISEDFLPIVGSYGIPPASVTVIENWAPLQEVPVRPRDNSWSDEMLGSQPGLRFLYSGTLGLKHNPDLLLQLAVQNPDAFVVVVSQGLGADWLSRKKVEMGTRNLIVLPFQDFERLPDVLAAGDILVAVLEPDADVFSVPSKVLTYLCAARPLLLAVPPRNLAARIVERNAAGIVVSPSDNDGFLKAAARLESDPGLRSEMAENARAYAERQFEIGRIADRFEAVLEQ
jgi:glycosyltransferase involved in cell wall biosynthesis